MLTPLVDARVLHGLRLGPLLLRMPRRHRRGPAPCSSLLLLMLLLLTPAIGMDGCASAAGRLPRGLLPGRLVRAPEVGFLHRRRRRRPSLLLPAIIPSRPLEGCAQLR